MTTQGSIPKMLRSGKYLSGHFCPIVIRHQTVGKHGERLIAWTYGYAFQQEPLLLRTDFVLNSMWQAEHILHGWILDRVLEAGLDPEKCCAPSNPDYTNKASLVAAYTTAKGQENGRLLEALPSTAERGPLRQARDRPRREVPQRQPRVSRAKPLPLPQLRSRAVPQALPAPGSPTEDETS